MRRTCPAPSSDREGFTFIELLAALAVAVLLAMGSASVAQSVLGSRASALRASRLALSILALEAAARVPEAPEDFLAGELPDGVRIESTADRGEKADRPGLALVDGERVAARIDDAGARR
jgi:prepilin-type N-terminal cleavage/methylation domain-containing protein